MLFDGKRPEEMTQDELEAAAVYCVRMEREAQKVASLNRAGLVELALEYERRLGVSGTVN